MVIRLKSVKEKIVVNFCPTGMVPTKALNPNVPISETEIVEQTHQAYELGITIAHLHARNEDESPAYQKTIYRNIFEGVKKHCPDLVICGSSSGRNFPEFERRSEVIELQPDMCSLTLSSLNFVNQASLNAPEMIVKLAEKMENFGVRAELEVFDLGMINFGKYLIAKNIISGPFYWNLIFGNIAGMQPSMLQIGSALAEIPQQHFIALGGIGKHQLKVNALAIANGLGLRVGLEDNLWFDDQRLVQASNMSLLKRVHQLIEIQGKTLFPPKEFGELGFYNPNR
jgi:3-keto-5-aminohexanoate cleavage enzyme